MGDDEWVPMYAAAVTGPHIHAAADLASLAADLEFAADAFARLVDIDPLVDGVLARALWDAGVIAYRRCFGGGKSMQVPGTARPPVPADIMGALDDNLQVLHERLLYEADKHVAHRVVSGDQCRILIAVNNPALGRALVGPTIFYIRKLAANKDEVESARDLARRLHGEVHARRDAEMAIIDEETRAMDLDDIYAHAHPLEPKIVGVEGYPD